MLQAIKLNMLTLGNLSSQVGANTLLHHAFSQNLVLPSKSTPFSTRTKPHVFFLKIRNGFCLKNQKKGNFSLSDVVDEDEFEDDFDDELFDIEGDGEFDGDNDVDEVDIPLKNMKKWLEKRPRGFGEGKVYDISIEDKLMEEIEQSRKAQLANVNKLKNIPVKPSSKKDTSPLKKASASIQEGFRVRLVNLPKKKNIHRDLRLAFEGVPGILEIVPVVSGNEKTRDPICKGLAFVDFKHENDAYRFVENFSGKSISFGKMQKNIKCEIVNTKSSKTSDSGLVDKTKHSPRKPLLLDENTNATIDMDISSFDLHDENAISEHHDAEEILMTEQYEDEGEFEPTSSVSDSESSEELDLGEESAEIKLPSSKQGRKPKLNERKVGSNRRKNKVPKLNVPGASKRLKIREKELLTGVFSKYGSNVNLNVKEHSK